MKTPMIGGSLAALVSTLGLALAPASQAAAPAVCNQASPHFQGGGLVALDPPVDSPAARYTDDLSPLPGQGKGLVRAASKSPALTLCGEGDNGGGDDDGGGVSWT
jgi:hypothetical protein